MLLWRTAILLAALDSSSQVRAYIGIESGRWERILQRAWCFPVIECRFHAERENIVGYLSTHMILKPIHEPTPYDCQAPIPVAKVIEVLEPTRVTDNLYHCYSEKAR